MVGFIRCLRVWAVGAAVPKVAEVGAAKEVDHFGVVGGGLFFEELVEMIEGAAIGGIAPDGRCFGFGHTR